MVEVPAIKSIIEEMEVKWQEMDVILVRPVELEPLLE